VGFLKKKLNHGCGSGNPSDFLLTEHSMPVLKGALRMIVARI
jgi:hypothetical protein